MLLSDKIPLVMFIYVELQLSTKSILICTNVTSIASLNVFCFSDCFFIYISHALVSKLLKKKQLENRLNRSQLRANSAN